MCGIAGIFYFNNNVVKTKYIKEILNEIKHRGPDAVGIWCEKQIGLGNVRLKVVDNLDSSNQPIISHSKRYIIVFNGEIYNFKEIKKKFNLKITGTSDTEVILELFAKIGTKTFHQLNGMYAISIYDRKLKKLYLARDPIGIKPLFYYQKKQSIFFASEIKGIINFQNNIVPNYNILVDFIKWGALDHSKNSWFKNIKNVEPGTFIEINSAGKFSVSKFWDLKKECESIQIKKENIEDYFLSLLQDSILKQSQTVRSIGTHLSGGVDSSIVTLLLSKLKNNIQTFTFGYKEKKYDERTFAKQVSNHLKIKKF